MESSRGESSGSAGEKHDSSTHAPEVAEENNENQSNNRPSGIGDFVSYFVYTIVLV